MKTIFSISTQHRFVSCALHLILLCALASPAVAIKSDFADSLFQEGDYLNAAHEYKRLLFSHPDAPQIDFVAFRVAASSVSYTHLTLPTKA